MRRELDQYRQIQSKARIVLEKIASSISEDSTELSISNQCIQLLAELGITQTWYYSVPALVLLGSRSCLSISGKNYIPASEKVGDRNLITIDLSPLNGDTWGDCARSFPIPKGRVNFTSQDPEFSQGIDAENILHKAFVNYVQPNMTFEMVFDEMNRKIFELGFVNLDFMGNVGHSIVKRKENRTYFMKGNTTRLDQVDLFTFEPHIRLSNGKWGFKHENIYFFDESMKLCEL